MLRVISGTARSIPLKTLPSSDTRPTTDRVKETLFNLLQDEIYGCSFLDLFAGSGQIGIEALSRGATEAVFIEKNKKACAIIEENLKKTRFSEKAVLISKDYKVALSFLSKKFDVIFMDPPYAANVEADVLQLIDSHDLLKDDGMVIIEAALKKDFSFVEDLPFAIMRTKVYKTNQHVFLRRLSNE